MEFQNLNKTALSVSASITQYFKRKINKPTIHLKIVLFKNEFHHFI